MQNRVGPRLAVVDHDFDNGNKLSQTVTRTTSTGAVETLTTQYEYDKENRLIRTTYPDNTKTEVEYNSIGKQSLTRDQLGRETRFEYDDMGHLVRTLNPDSTKEESTYDAEGRRLTSTDRFGHTTTFEEKRGSHLESHRSK